MQNLRRIVFFWVGQDISLPTLLVFSIRRRFGADMEVVQLSDLDTPEVEGVSRCQRMKLSPLMMVARLEAYRSLAISEPTLFLDADMMIVKPFDLPALQPNEIGVTPRTDRGEINWRAPIEFPEFKGKTFGDEMPYIYSFLYTSTPDIFARQLDQLRKLPRRFQEWYGDQVTLKRELDSQQRFIRRDFDVRIYNRAVQSVGEFNVLLGTELDVCIVHFKGPRGKVMFDAMMRFLRGAPAGRRPPAAYRPQK
jgi:hypothetical protein